MSTAPLPAVHSASLARSRNAARQSRPRLGYLLVLTVPLAAVFSLDGVRIAGFNYTGWIWVGQFLAALALLQAEMAVRHRLPHAFSCWPWCVFGALLASSLLWCDAWSLRNLQDLAQIGMPLIIGITASVFIRAERQLLVLLRCFGITAGISLLLLPAMKLGAVGNSEGLNERGLGLTAAVAGTVLLAGTRRAFWPALAGWTICLLVTVLTGSRMATVCLILAPVLHPLFHKWIAKLLAIALMALLAVGVFHTETFQKRFFYSGSGTLADVWTGDFASLGRFEAWPAIWDEAWRRPILGHGVGTATKFVPTVWETVTHVHNDYLRLGFEIGLIGLTLFLLAMIWQLRTLRRLLREAQPRSVLQHALAAAYMGLLVFLVLASTDNPLMYNIWFTNPVFALLGGASGVLHEQQIVNDSMRERWIA